MLGMEPPMLYWEPKYPSLGGQIALHRRHALHEVVQRDYFPEVGSSEVEDYCKSIITRRVVDQARRGRC